MVIGNLYKALLPAGMPYSLKDENLVLLIGAAIGDFAYKPSGWRPTGPSFTPHGNRFRPNGYNNKPLTSYGAPDIYPGISTAMNVDQTRAPTTAITNTPQSPESTTPLNIDDDDDFQTNPALAIANSFAFNKPSAEAVF
ncbi:hypothetical protein PV325_006269 [Microctonus aethiopoides]|nr:hypothetical protein PV325_006269 [Microctonus aethiopoides]